MRIGLVGAGNIGRHFAARWAAAGHCVSVYDTCKKARSHAASMGAIPAADLGKLIANQDAIALSLPTPEVVVAVTQAIVDLAHVHTVRLIVDLSTTGADATVRVDTMLKEAGVPFFSAPVSGGTVAAAEGRLTVMAAGPLPGWERAMPMFDAIARHTFYLGPNIRLGQTLKLINNTLYAACMLASCEALVCGTKAGIEAHTLLNVINRSSGRCFATMERLPNALDRTFPLRFKTSLLRKDVHLALMAADELGVPMQVSRAALRLLDDAMVAGLGEADNITAIRVVERHAGVVFGDL
ncbi:NAD(P)-dependent oxidoreductase [Xanthomonas campestris pv. cannae]|nr:NAD(P)-dependent oxidoreductase [Xanthomonas campestris pv. cannae]